MKWYFHWIVFLHWRKVARRGTPCDADWQFEWFRTVQSLNFKPTQKNPANRCQNWIWKNISEIRSLVSSNEDEVHPMNSTYSTDCNRTLKSTRKCQEKICLNLPSRVTITVRNPYHESFSFPGSFQALLKLPNFFQLGSSNKRSPQKRACKWILWFNVSYDSMLEMLQFCGTSLRKSFNFQDSLLYSCILWISWDL